MAIDTLFASPPSWMAYQSDVQEYCAAAAAHLLRDREKRYPATVNNGKMTAAQSADGLEIMRVIVAQWRWAIDKARPALPPFSDETGRFGAQNRVLEAEMQRVAETARARADRAPSDNERRKMAELCEALAWYQQTLCGDARLVWHHLDREAAAMSAAA